MEHRGDTLAGEAALPNIPKPIFDRACDDFIKKQFPLIGRPVGRKKNICNETEDSIISDIKQMYSLVCIHCCLFV